MSNPALDLIKVEMDRLKARKAQLETGLVAHQKDMELQQQATQSLKDEIQTIADTLEELRAARKNLNGHARIK
jgi:chromosome segregation ATPase